MLTDGPTKWGPDNSDATISTDSIQRTKHAPRPGRPNLPNNRDGLSRHWRHPIRAVARGCKSVLPNIRALFTKRPKPAPQAQQPAASVSTTLSNTNSTSLTSRPNQLQAPGASLDPSATHTTNHPRPPKPNPASRLSISCPEPSANNEQSIFLVDAPIQVYHGPGAPQGDNRYGVVLYDSGCEYDLISTGYLAERRKPEEDVVKRAFAMSITGEPFDSLGTAGIRWKDDDFSSLRYIDTSCLIVESDFFDVIIGRKTMQKLRLFVRNPDLIAAPLITPMPKVEGMSSPSSRPIMH